MAYSEETMAVRKQVEIGGQTIWVDSLLEERVLLWLEAHGFHDRWRKPAVGLKVGTRNYTPDVELYIQHDGKTHLAIVEIKPVLWGKFGFSNYIFKRMRIAAKVYYAKILLLYVEETRIWYRIDTKTGELQEFGTPVPAGRPIARAYKPLTLRARSVGYHRYRERMDYRVINKLADGMEALVQALFVTQKQRRRKRPRL